MSVLVAHLCPTLCDPMDRISPGSFVHWVLQGRYTEVGCRFLQGIFPTQRLNLGLPLLGEPHYRPLLYHEPPGRVGVHKIYSAKHLIIISEHSNTLFLTSRFLSSSPLLCVVGLKIQNIMRKPKNA